MEFGKPPEKEKVPDGFKYEAYCGRCGMTLEGVEAYVVRTSYFIENNGKKQTPFQSLAICTECNIRQTQICNKEVMEMNGSTLTDPQGVPMCKGCYLSKKHCRCENIESLR